MRFAYWRSVNRKDMAVRLLFLGYCALMLWLLFGQRMEGTLTLNPSMENVNFTPLATLKLYLRLLQTTENRALIRHAVVNLVGNVVMFMPLGWFVPRIFHRLRHFFASLLVFLAVICLVEGVQYATGLGSCDVDDLILNLPGCVLGWLTWRLARKR